MNRKRFYLELVDGYKIIKRSYFELISDLLALEISQKTRKWLPFINKRSYLYQGK